MEGETGMPSSYARVRVAFATGLVVVIVSLSSLLAPSKARAADSTLYEFPLARFGSGVVFDPCPVQGGIRLMAMGRQASEPVPARFGFSITRQVWTLPFEREGTAMRRFEQRVTPTSLTISGSTEAETLRYDWTAISPFVPGDARVSTAPVFLIEIRVENTGRRRRPCLVHVQLPLPGEGVERLDLGRVSALRSSPGPSEEWILAWPEDHGFVFARDDDRLRFGCELGPRQHRTLRFALAAYRDDTVATLAGDELRFKYTQSFDDARDVATWALRDWDDLVAASRAFDATLTETGLPRAVSDLAASAFQTFASSTTWLVDAQGHDRLWIEDPASGRAISYREMLFATPFLCSYWPEAFVAWFAGRHDAASIAEEDDRLRFADSYRAGAGLAAALRAPAAFEECAAWLLLLDRALAVDAALTLDRFAAWFDVSLETLRGAATDPDFDRDEVFPNTPAYDGAAGWLSLGALEASARRMRESDERERARALENLAERRRDELETRFWRGDHYGMFAGHDGGAPGVLAACLPAIRNGDRLAMPERERHRADLAWLRAELGTARGLGESLGDRRTSIAAACARGLVAAYEGEPVDLAWFERMRDASIAEAVERESLEIGGYRDRPGAATDAPSMRGMILFDVPRALASLRLDDYDGVGYRVPADLATLRVAIVERAQWGEPRVPWLEIERRDAGSLASLRHRALLGSSAEVYERDADVRESITLDLLTGRAPVVRASGMRVLDRSVRGGSWRIELRDRIEASQRVRLRVPALPPGEYVVGSYAGDLATFDAAHLREGVELDRALLALDASASASLGDARPRYLALGDRVDALAADRETPDWAATPLGELAMAIDARLDADRRARTLRIDLRRRGADVAAAGTPSAPMERGEPSDREAGRASIPERMGALFERALDAGDERRTERFVRALQPFEWSFAVEPSGARGAGTLRFTNRWLPEVAGSVEVVERGANAAEATTFEALGTGETHVATLHVPIGSGEATESGIVPLHDVIEARARIEWGGRALEVEREFGLTSGVIESWLLSRVYTSPSGVGEAEPFDRVEPPETEAAPRIASGDANWRTRDASSGRLDLGTSMRVADRYAAYAYAAVGCESGGEIVLAGEASGRVRVLVNGVVVFAPGAEAFTGGRFQTRATLAPGWNDVLVKVENGPGGWGLRLGARGVDPALDRELRVVAHGE